MPQRDVNSEKPHKFRYLKYKLGHLYQRVSMATAQESGTSLQPVLSVGESRCEKG